jgi:mRNA deadenylase 3'-5' endonuclease subunit Ccr4
MTCTFGIKSKERTDMIYLQGCVLLWKTLNNSESKYFKLLAAEIHKGWKNLLEDM